MLALQLHRSLLQQQYLSGPCCGHARALELRPENLLMPVAEETRLRLEGVVSECCAQYLSHPRTLCEEAAKQDGFAARTVPGKCRGLLLPASEVLLWSDRLPPHARPFAVPAWVRPLGPTQPEHWQWKAIE
eukprot:1339902-Amphidinium_carterae.2